MVDRDLRAYRHLSESSSGSAYTKSTETAGLDSSGGADETGIQPVAGYDTGVDKIIKLYDDTVFGNSDDTDFKTTEHSYLKGSSSTRETDSERSCATTAFCIPLQSKPSDKKKGFVVTEEGKAEEELCFDSKTDNLSKTGFITPDNVENSQRPRDQYSEGRKDRSRPSSICMIDESDMQIESDISSTANRTDTKAILARDHFIHGFQFDNLTKMTSLIGQCESNMDEVNKLRKLIKTSFQSILCGLVVIVSCVAVIIIYVLTNHASVAGTTDMEYLVERYLSTSEIMEDVRQDVRNDVRADVRNDIFCASCSDVTSVSGDMMPWFPRAENRQCCVEDLPTLALKMRQSFTKEFQPKNSRLSDLENKVNEMERKLNIKQMVVNVGSDDGGGNVANLNKLLDTSLSKIDSNERMINSLIEYKRSAIHLVGYVHFGRLRWHKIAGNIESADATDSGTITLTGGVYFVYCTIRFACNSIGARSRVSFGYRLDEIGSRGGPKTLAEVRQQCVNGSDSGEYDLTLQRIITIPLDQGKKIALNTLSSGSYISNSREHMFGLFEL